MSRHMVQKPLLSDESLQEVFEYLISGIVAHPENVRLVLYKRNGRGLSFELGVHADDLGRVIGRGGRTVQALRTLLQALVEPARVYIDVVENNVEVLPDGEESFEVADEVAEADLEIDGGALH